MRQHTSRMLTHADLLELRFHQVVPPCLDRLDILGQELEDTSLQRRLAVGAYLRTYATHALNEAVLHLLERARVLNDAPVQPQKHRCPAHTSAYVSSIRQQHTSACVSSIRQHTSAYVSVPAHTHRRP